MGQLLVDPTMRRKEGIDVTDDLVHLIKVAVTEPQCI